MSQRVFRLLWFWINCVAQPLMAGFNLALVKIWVVILYHCMCMGCSGPSVINWVGGSKDTRWESAVNLRNLKMWKAPPLSSPGLLPI